MKRVIQILIALVAIAAGIAGAWYGRNTYLDNVVTVQLPVPQSEIEPYTMITPAMLAWREYPRALVSTQQDYVTQPEQLVGKISTSTLVAGLPIPAQRVASPDEFRLAAAELEVVSIPVSPEFAVGGQVKIGDKINVYRLTAWEENAQNALLTAPIDVFTETVPVTPDRPSTFTEVELIATVPVVQVLSGDGIAEANEGEDPQPLQILVLAAPPEVARQILEAQAATTVGNNQIWITLAVPDTK